MKDKIALPWHPAPYDTPEVAATKAVAGGTASPEQQQRFMRFLIEVVSGYHDLSFRPDSAGGERGSCFMEGRRYVGQQITKLINLPMSVVRKTDGSREQPS